MSVGMELDLRTVAEYPFWLPASVVGLLLIKATVITLLLWRLGVGQAVQAGMLMGQGGEFAFIVLGYAVTARLLPAETGQFLLVVVSLSMLAAPGSAALGQRFAAWWDSTRGGCAAAVAGPGAGEPPRAGHIVIGGYGRVGRLVADVLARHGIEHVAIERDHHLVAAARKETGNLHSGDASMPHLLARLGIGECAAVVLTMDDPKAALEAVRALRRHYPALPIIARARDEKHARLLKGAGANEVISETVESGLQLARFALSSAGMPEGAAGLHIQVERAERIATATGAAEEPAQRN
ncbi:NAD-binding protein [Pseudoduganella chitinolytica]|uniref:NAD-binding protein n=2 Tax=Pseudoduganella chitinolytica TaxID=34070 RepID=A0ABY8BKR2_9BURK|nr:NAD-binding protein [Pseudoduganella chitinolytica]WEF35496.1 NAD-binding protein [Pseudoduganella chitinolytica]